MNEQWREWAAAILTLLVMICGAVAVFVGIGTLANSHRSGQPFLSIGCAITVAAGLFAMVMGIKVIQRHS